VSSGICSGVPATVAIASAATTCGWSSNFTRTDLDGAIWDMAVFDDGTGAALYAGGTFKVAGGQEVNHIAKWDGTSWSALPGTSSVGVNDEVRALAVYDDGSGPALFVGGDFTEVGGSAADYVARWDGTSWSPLTGASGSGTDAPVWSFGTFDDGNGEALYVGGEFLNAGGHTVYYIGRWDGTEWSALVGTSGTGTNSAVHAMVTFDDGSGPSLFVGGRFFNAGSIWVSRIAKWDGADWTALSGPSDTGVGSWVEALIVWDDGTGAALYAGGQFTTAGGLAANYVARWDGSAWSALDGPSGNGADWIVWSLEIFDGALIAGGKFETAGGVAVNEVARWDGSQWAALGGPSGVGVEGDAHALAVFDDGTGDALYAGGGIRLAGGEHATSIARWDGAGWSSLVAPAGDGVNGQVRALLPFDDGGGEHLYVGGIFGGAGDITAKNIASWDGDQWSSLTGPGGEGIDNLVEALAVYDDGTGSALYVAGWFETAGGVLVNKIARWDGSEWSALTGPADTGVGGTNSIRALAVYDDGNGPALYAGGFFSTAGGIPANNIARWNGIGWYPLYGQSGNGVSGAVEALAVYDSGDGPSLIVGGQFMTAAGIEANRIARFDGTDWYSMGKPSDPGFSYDVTSLAVYDDGSGPALYAGGHFGWAGTDDMFPHVVNHIARWTGGSWIELDDGVAIGTPGGVRSLTTYTIGGDVELIVGVSTTVVGSIPASNIGSWNGSRWSALEGEHGEGLDSWPRASTVWDDGGGSALFVGGAMRFAGGVRSRFIAKWICAVPIFSDDFEAGDVTAWSIVVAK
jgi:hypothetical protein